MKALGCQQKPDKHKHKKVQRESNSIARPSLCGPQRRASWISLLPQIWNPVSGRSSQQCIVSRLAHIWTHLCLRCLDIRIPQQQEFKAPDFFSFFLCEQENGRVICPHECAIDLVAAKCIWPAFRRSELSCGPKKKHPTFPNMLT